MIGTLEPVIARGSLVFLESAVEMDDALTEMYNNTGKRSIYSVFHQMSKVTRVRKCLKHDDRLDALAGSVAHWVDQLALDQKDVIEKNKAKEFTDWINDPTGMKAASRNAPHNRNRGSLLNRYR